MYFDKKNIYIIPFLLFFSCFFGCSLSHSIKSDCIECSCLGKNDVKDLLLSMSSNKEIKEILKIEKEIWIDIPADLQQYEKVLSAVKQIKVGDNIIKIKIIEKKLNSPRLEILNILVRHNNLVIPAKLYGFGGDRWSADFFRPCSKKPVQFKCSLGVKAYTSN